MLIHLANDVAVSAPWQSSRRRPGSAARGDPRRTPPSIRPKRDARAHWEVSCGFTSLCTPKGLSRFFWLVQMSVDAVSSDAETIYQLSTVALVLLSIGLVLGRPSRLSSGGQKGVSGGPWRTEAGSQFSNFFFLEM